ncbi:MAG: Uma2 family endonuclease [Acidimicrobiales bacterium]
MGIKAAVAFTYEDLAGFPDDGYRRELVHGQLIVNPTPVPKHQWAVMSLAYLLTTSCPPDLITLPAPCDWAVSEDTVLEPDLMVVRREDVGPKRIEGTPLLVVEVLSPSTRDTDTTIKRFEYERAGARSYWIVDPDIPDLTVLRLEGDRYVEEAVVAGDETYDADWPYRLSITPSDLLR